MMKRIFFGLFAAALAIGGSAFTNAASKPHFATFYYVLTTPGTYVRTLTTPVNTNCLNTATHKCWVEYAADQGDGFSSASIPAGAIAQSPTNGIYQ